jgi:DNA-binding protein H-NS
LLNSKKSEAVGGEAEINDTKCYESTQPGYKPMKKLDFEKISLDELWALHEQISRILSSRIVAEKEHLEKRLIQLHRGEKPKIAALMKSKSAEAKRDRPRRKYPKVYPKYQNPADPSETWSGRGKQPRWLTSALKSGKSMEDLEISKDTKEPADA